MTISPPANVKSDTSEPFQVLASGFDSLYLAIDISWKNEFFFNYLEEMKNLAIQNEKETAITFRNEKNETLWPCTIKPHGAKGHEWILRGSEYHLTIGKWLEPKPRPSVLAQIHSEALWRFGAQVAVERLLHILSQSGANIKSVKVSRVDLCVDITFPDKLWSIELINFRVTRASYLSPHFHHKSLTGISIGKSKVVARLYDKPLEIKQQSKKFWLYDIWGLENAPKGQKIIRVEFQLRREAIKDLGLDSVFSLFEACDSLWAYCTKQWLKFQDNPGKHPNQRQTFSWWQTIQKAFLGVQGANPLIRYKSLKPQRKQLFEQTYGFLTSFKAMDMEFKGYAPEKDATLESMIHSFEKMAQQMGKNDYKVSIDVHDKRSRYHRSKEKTLEVFSKRNAQGFPDNLPTDEILKELKGNEKWKSILQRKN